MLEVAKILNESDPPRNKICSEREFIDCFVEIIKSRLIINSKYKRTSIGQICVRETNSQIMTMGRYGFGGTEYHMELIRKELLLLGFSCAILYCSKKKEPIKLVYEFPVTHVYEGDEIRFVYG